MIVSPKSSNLLAAFILLSITMNIVFGIGYPWVKAVKLLLLKYQYSKKTAKVSATTQPEKNEKQKVVE